MKLWQVPQLAVASGMPYEEKIWLGIKFDDLAIFSDDAKLKFHQSCKPQLK